MDQNEGTVGGLEQELGSSFSGGFESAATGTPASAPAGTNPFDNVMSGIGSDMGQWVAHEIQMPTTASGATVHVDKANVMQAGKVIQDQVDHLTQVVLNNAQNLTVLPPGQDLISTQMANAWNWRLSGAEDSYLNRVNAYIQSLHGLANNLRDSAKQYGYSEDDITHYFGPKNA